MNMHRINKMRKIELKLWEQIKLNREYIKIKRQEILDLEKENQQLELQAAEICMDRIETKNQEIEIWS